MTARTVNLLSEQAEAELYREAGLDVASLEEEPFKTFVLCGECDGSGESPYGGPCEICKGQGLVPVRI